MPSVQRYAAMVGCPEKYLYLADPEYAKATSYVIHKFRDFQVRGINGEPKNLQASDMPATCAKLMEDLFQKKGTLTVINGHPSLQETYLLFWHLVCHFASIKLSNPIKHQEHVLSFAGNFRLEQNHYICRRRHVLAFGPVIDEMNNYHTSNYVDTLMRYDDLNLIMLTSTTDVTGLLERLRVVTKDVTHFFNLSERLEDTPTPKGLAKKKARSKSIKNLAASL